MNKVIRLIDRSRTVADWKCPRARYWGYELEGRGIVRKGTSLELSIGLIVHDILDAIAVEYLNNRIPDIDLLAVQARDKVVALILDGSAPIADAETIEYANEQGALIEGMIRGFYKHVWPRLMDQYTIVCPESEMELPLTDELLFMTRPDLICEDKEGNLVYIEYKTTSSKKEEWINSWETAVQLHSSIKATERALGRPVEYVQIIGLYKGFESYGKQSSPFCYAYVKKGHPPFIKDQIEYEYKSGFRRSPTWVMEGGVKAWVESMPENVLTNQFPFSPPIFVNDELIERFFQQRIVREGEIAQAVIDLEITEGNEVEILDRVFPQKFDQCTPQFGYPCQYKKLCHGSSKDPLNNGYTLREPHHELEREMLGLDKVDIKELNEPKP